MCPSQVRTMRVPATQVKPSYFPSEASTAHHFMCRPMGGVWALTLLSCVGQVGRYWVTRPPAMGKWCFPSDVGGEAHPHAGTVGLSPSGRSSLRLCPPERQKVRYGRSPELSENHRSWIGPSFPAAFKETSEV